MSMQQQGGFNQGPTGGVSNDAKAMMFYEANKKSAVIAYLLWFFVGGFGGHRFYSGRTGSGIAQLVLLIVGIVLAPIGIGLILLVPLGIWVLVDAFLIPGWIRLQNVALAQSIG